MAAHARFAPSAAHRWMHCPASLQYTDAGSSSYADEGSAAHALASRCLDEHRQAAALIGTVIYVADNGIEYVVDDDMAGHVQVYLDAIRRAADGKQLLIEQKVLFHRVLRLDPEQMAGTSDAIIVGDGVLEVHDLKYGRGEQVFARGNEQLMLYALGALDMVGELFDIHTVRFAIHQPRLNHLDMHELPRTELEYFAVRVIEAVTRANDNPGTHAAGPKQCRWCPAKASCAALAEFVQNTIAAEFDDLTTVVVPAEPATLAQKMVAVDLVEDWCRAVRAKVEQLLFAGSEVPGFKLVQGKRGARKWSNETEVEEIMKAWRLKREEMYSLALISPAAAEKLLKTNPKRWAKLTTLVTQSPGKPSVAPTTDPRPAYSPGATADEFRDLTA